ncbi:MAG: nucleoside phosphorylase [Chitinophagaceae bacterium]|nr:nucleoside phosphorylase [Chitinophagaceae bacterium]
MQYIGESELILNKRGAVYHLDLLPEELAGTIITVGDPERVQEVSKYFDVIEYKCSHREFVTHTGRMGNRRLSVVSTGIGTDNIDIVMNELDALVNIDLLHRTAKPTLSSLQIIRIGTAGSLQQDIAVDDFVASTHGIGLDNLLHFYRAENNEEENQLIQAFATQVPSNRLTVNPYISSANVGLIKYFVKEFHQGITATCPGFYGPQARVLRLGLQEPALLQLLSAFSFGTHRICNFEMETAAIYGLGRLLGHHCLSLSAIIANRVTKKFSHDPYSTVDRLIRRTLETIMQIPS